VLKIFEETGNVEAGKSSGRPKALNVYDEFIIIENVIENPSIYLHEIKEDLTGREVDVSTICRFLHRNAWVFTAKTEASSSATQPRTPPKVYD